METGDVLKVKIIVYILLTIFIYGRDEKKKSKEKRMSNLWQD